MKIINASTEILTPITGDELQIIEYAGRTCYKSEDKITDDSAKKVLVMKNVKTPFLLRRKVVTVTSICFGAIMGGLLSSIGQNSGVYRGAKETNEKWKVAVDEVFKQAKNESEEEKTE